MFYNKHMQPIDRLEDLRNASSFIDLEPAEETGCPEISRVVSSTKKEVFLSDAVLPNGKRIRLMKTLLTSACERNCFYCPFRAGRDFHRITFKPDELAQTFNSLHRAGLVEGIFLSSGVAGGSVRTQDQLLATAEILRRKIGFKGYLHLKLMPGIEKEQVYQAMTLANRVSVNLEAPNSIRLEKLAPRKAFMDELLQPLKWVEEIRKNQPSFKGWQGRWPSMSTQYVVGAAGESDLELLQTTGYLYRNLRLGRAYFSAFSPIIDTPFENLPAEQPIREYRLYQASFLLRDYGFQFEEMPFDPTGNLPLRTDPKLAWAKGNLLEKPVEINGADRNELLKVPGIGPKGAGAILSARSQGKLRDLASLGKLGINSSRAAPFILLDGKSPSRQLSFW